MPDVTTLIKMQKLLVDDQRRVLAARQAEVDRIENDLRVLREGLEMEKHNPAALEEGGYMLGPFIQAELEREEDLKEKLVSAVKVMEAEREKLATLFEELKRYEIVQENWEAEQEAGRSRTERITYDEQAGVQHRRRKDDT